MILFSKPSQSHQFRWFFKISSIFVFKIYSSQNRRRRHGAARQDPGKYGSGQEPTNLVHHLIFIISVNFLLKTRFESTFSRFCLKKIKKYKIIVSKGTPNFWPPPFAPPSCYPEPLASPAWPRASPPLTLDKKFKIIFIRAHFYDFDVIFVVFSSKIERIIFSHFFKIVVELVEPRWPPWQRWNYGHAREDPRYWSHATGRHPRDQAQIERGGWRSIKNFVWNFVQIVINEWMFYFLRQFFFKIIWFFQKNLCCLGPQHLRGSGY